MHVTTLVTSVRHPRRLLAVGEAVLAAGAVAGSIGLVTGSLDMGRSITSRFPFGSAVVAGTALLAVVGVPMTVASVDAALVAGLLLMGWIVVEVVVIRTFSWLQPACFTAGAVIAIAGNRGSSG